MSGNYRRLLQQFAISASVAVIMPAAAAGLIVGISAAASNVASAGPDQSVIADIAPAITPAQADPFATAPAAVSAATHAPTRLSDLAGTDDAAWASVGHPAHKHAAAKPSPAAPCAHPCTDR